MQKEIKSATIISLKSQRHIQRILISKPEVPPVSRQRTDTLQVNLGESHQLSNGLFWPLLIGYLGYTAGWVVLLYRRYRLPSDVEG